MHTLLLILDRIPYACTSVRVYWPDMAKLVGSYKAQSSMDTFILRDKGLLLIGYPRSQREPVYTIPFEYTRELNSGPPDDGSTEETIRAYYDI